MTEETIFSEARAISNPAVRAAYLNRICAGDTERKKRIEELLSAYDSSNPLDRPLMDLARTGAYQPSDEDLPPAAVGDRVGPYRLMEQIGEGGFGLVFVAEQTEPVRRKVALKVLKPGMDTRDVVARFEAERQALALMDHPNIARVFDAGSTNTGRPYFVMELVRGVPITEFCDQQKLPPNDRLALFVLVCNAVQHAHQKGVIHRDIKPSNILVTSHDGVPVPKVIDFGVAKAVGQSLTEKTIYTRFAQMIGTPLYMSPEQAEMSGLDVDTRADVYALGVLLYELLTGSTPFDKERFRAAAFDEIRRIIREEEPPKPSTRLTSLGATLTSICASRNTEPSKLAGLVRGELDWIVMKALEKDRNRRYDTANGLAKDVQRYLSGDAVEACPPTLSYRLKKAYRKNRAAVRVVCAFLGLMTGTVLATAWLAIKAKRAEAEAELNAESARQALIDAEKQQEIANAANIALKESSEQQRRILYSTEMNLIENNYKVRDYNGIRSLLEHWRPEPGKEDLRGFEWHYWNRKLSGFIKEKVVELGRQIPIDSSAMIGWHEQMSKDGRFFARASWLKEKNLEIGIWDTNTGEKIDAVDFTWEDSMLNPGRLKIDFDEDCNKVLCLLNFYSYRPSAEPRQLACLRDLKTKTSTPILLPNQAAYYEISADLSLMCPKFLSESETKKHDNLTVYGLPDGKPIASWKNPDGAKYLYSDFSPDGKAIYIYRFKGEKKRSGRLMAFAENYLSRWTIGKSEPDWEIEIESQKDLVQAADSNLFYLVDDLDKNYRISIRDSANGHEIEQFSIPMEGASNGSVSAAISPNGRYLVLPEAFGACIVDLKDPQRNYFRIESDLGVGIKAVISKDSQFLITCGLDGTNGQDGMRRTTERVRIRTWKLEASPAPLFEEGVFNQDHLESDSKVMAYRVYEIKNNPNLDDKKVTPLISNEWRVFGASGNRIANIPLGAISKYGPFDASFSNDGQKFACLSEGNSIQIWDLRLGKQITTIHPKPGERFGWIVFAPDGTKIACKVFDTKQAEDFDFTQNPKLIRIYGAQTGKFLFERPTPGGEEHLSGALTWQDTTGPVVSYIKDGGVGFKPPLISKWNVNSGNVTAWEEKSDLMEPTRIHFSKDRSRKAIFKPKRNSLSSIEIYECSQDKSQDRFLRRFEIKPSVTFLGLSPDGKRFLTVQDDQLAHIDPYRYCLWDIATGYRLLSLSDERIPRYRQGIGVLWNEDGTKLWVAEGTDGKLFGFDGTPLPEPNK